MSKIVAIEHISMDGVIQAPARPDEDTRDGFRYGGWSAAGSDPAMQQVIGARMGSSWSLLAGRFTYEDVLGFWSRQPPNPFTDALTNVEKFVASTTLTEPLAYPNSTLLKGNILDAITELKRTHDKTLVIFGSSVLVQSLIEGELLDELLLLIHPVVIGQGRRLFASAGPFAKFNLLESTTTATGVVMSTWTVPTHLRR